MPGYIANSSSDRMFRWAPIRLTSRSLTVGKPGLLCLDFATSLPSATVGHHHSREGMSTTTLDKQERNPRGIPRAPFIVRILLSSQGG